ncbi:MFS transporter [Pararoseomonas indoligenes]|nr:MFS transporter [Pararoseomonas indoligenes]
MSTSIGPQGMAHSAGQPHSTELERHAREANRGHGGKEHPVAPGEIAIGVVIGRTSEFFDFFVYAIASVLVFPRFLFPESSPNTGMLLSFALFALAFVARPIGSVIFMWVDRRHGRAVKLTIALFLLGSATAGIAFLPGHGWVGGWAAALLGLFRFAQGIALGGTWDGLASLLALNAPEKKRGWYAMLPQLGAPLGFLLAASIFAFLLSALPDGDFQDWGWRYPFFVAFAVNVVALFARLRIVATDEFSNLLEKDELQPVRVKALMQENGRNVVIGAFVPLATFALFHLVTVFPLAWIILQTERDGRDVLEAQMIGAAVMVFTVLLSGWIGDLIGRRRLLGISAVLIGAFAFAGPYFLSGRNSGPDTFIILGFALLGLSFGQSSGAVASRFTRNLRYTGSALTSDAAWLIGAGFAPLVVLALSNAFGVAAVGAYLLSGVACTLLALTTNRQLEMRDR